VNALYFSPDRQFDDSTTASFAGNSPPVVGVDAAEDRGEVAGGNTGGGGGVAVHGALGGGAWHPAGDRGEIVPSAIRAAVAARRGHLTN